MHPGVLRLSPKPWKYSIMPLRWLVTIGIVGTMLFSQNAFAQVIVVPPILGGGLEPARDILIDRISSSLTTNKVAELKVDRFMLLKLSQCKNKMSCISSSAQSTGASHALHIILARRKNKVLTQITLLDISNSNPVERVRARAALGLSFIEKTITDSMVKVTDAIRKLPQYQNEGTLFRKPKVRSSNSTRVTMGNKPPPVPNPNSGFGGAPPIVNNPGAYWQADLPMIDGPNYIAYTFWGLAGALALGSGASFAMYGLDIQARSATPQTELIQRTELLRSAQSRQLTGYITLGGAVGVGLVGVLFQLTGWGASKVPVTAPPPLTTTGPTATYTWTF